MINHKIQRIRASNTGKIRSGNALENIRASNRRLEHRASVSVAMSGKPRSAEHVRHQSEAHRGKRVSAAARENIKRAHKVGAEHPMWGRRPAHVKKVVYNGTMFRSSYEVRFAKALDMRGITWEYEQRRFDLGVCTYLPDFFVPETGAFWEVKGWHNASSQMKARLFRDLYPEHPLIIATHDVITMMEGSTNGCRYMEDRSPIGEPGPLAQQCAKRTA